MLLQAFQGWSKYLGLQVGKIRHLAHPLNGRVLLVIMALNMALVLTTFPLSQALFIRLAGGILLTSAAAVILAGPAGKAAAREAVDAGEAMLLEAEKGYEQLASE
ncbi:unnamed protein product [Symbiodinium microadriaticum]|nr:unnamed protein product [Symbiodinium microadriaticum]